MSEDNSLEVEQILRKCLETDAKERLSNIRLINPKLYENVSSMIVNMYKAGHMDQKIDDYMLKEILQRMNVKREFSIRRG